MGDACAGSDRPRKEMGVAEPGAAGRAIHPIWPRGSDNVRCMPCLLALSQTRTEESLQAVLSLDSRTELSTLVLGTDYAKAWPIDLWQRTI